MSRLSFLLVAVGLAAGAGCTQCDTCDDFPTPCNGPNCGYPSFSTYGAASEAAPSPRDEVLNPLNPPQDNSPSEPAAPSGTGADTVPPTGTGPGPFTQPNTPNANPNPGGADTPTPPTPPGSGTTSTPNAQP
ncbi:MAG TPA: hypothetical protein VGZ22_19020 [Isosphaeraceae bacterium]|jgi:hypothetical protein|nr:hypothetical protein [Isosphaeraceae bacterium]